MPAEPLTAEQVAAADLLNVAATLARLSFFAGLDADEISHESHNNIIMLAQRTKRSRDRLVATVEQLTEQRDAARAVIRHALEQWVPVPHPFDEWTDIDWADSGWTPAEADAIRQARAARPQEPA